jgi:RNA polymerase sigma factor (sigma-70 family)
LQRLYRSSEKLVHAYIAKNNGTSDDAEDMLQEAVVIVWERIRAGRYEHKAQLSTFVYSTVRNMWMRKLARARRQSRVDDIGDTLPSDDLSPLEELIHSEKASRLAEALKQLGEQCRELLLLFYWEELSMEEIADRLGFANADTVKSKKYQCKKTLEQLMKGL